MRDLGLLRGLIFPNVASLFRTSTGIPTLWKPEAVSRTESKDHDVDYCRPEHQQAPITLKQPRSRFACEHHLF